MSETLSNNGFNAKYHLGSNELYSGNADVVVLLWNSDKLDEAEEFIAKNFSEMVVDVAVCKDPNWQKVRLNGKAIIFTGGS